MQHDLLIDTLGGAPEVARLLDVHPITVWRWRDKGIPISYWPALQRAAAQLDPPVIISDEALKLGIPYTGLKPEQVS